MCAYHSGEASNSSNAVAHSNQTPKPPATKAKVASLPTQQKLKSQDSFAARLSRKKGPVSLGGDATPKRGGLAESAWSNRTAARARRTP
jgi:hypothetical protein